MPYRINPFTGNPDYYDPSSGGTVTSVASGTGLTGGPITTTGTLSVDSATVPYYAGGPGSAGFVKWNGTAWAIDTTNYVNKAGDTMTGSLILNADPTTALGAATKQYVDNIATGINFHAPVVAATTGPLPAVTYNNGTGGVNATLTATANGALSIDTVTFLGGGTERVLIKNQASGLENGIYVVTQPGGVSSLFVLTRATDADNSPTGELAFGDFCFVEQGPTNGSFGYILNTPGTITVGVTPLSYVIFNAAQVVTAGTGLTELPTNTLNIDTAKVPYYSGGFSAGFAKWNGSSWIFDNSTYLDTTTAASTYLTQANALLQYYPLSSNPAGYITSGSLSGYVPYTGATGNVNLGAFQLTTSQVNISTVGALTTTAGVLKLEAAAATNLILNTPNVTTGASTKIQFGGVDVLELKGPSSTTTITNFIYTNPDNTNQVGPVSSMIIDPGTRQWTNAGVPNGPTDVQKEIEILAPTYTYPGPSSFWDGLPVTLYVNAPITDTQGVGVALGIKGHFIMNGDATEYPGGTYMSIGNGDGTMIGGVGAKLSFFGNPPVVRQGPVTTVQGLSTALENLGLIFPSTLNFGTTGSVLFAGASGALSQDNANFFWDDTNNRLGIGTATPSQSLDIIGKVLIRDNSAITPLNYDLEVHKTVNGEVSGWIRNNSAGNAAFAQLGTRVDSSTQFKMGIYSSGFTTSGLLTAGTAYLLTAGTNASKILIGNQTASKDIIFVNGGTVAANEIFRISSTNTIDIYDARNLTFGTTTGTKIGTATTQKLGFFNATPIVQPAAVTTVQGLADALGSATGLGLIATSTVRLPVEIQASCSDETSNLSVSTGRLTFRAPHALTLTSVRINCTTAPTGAAIIVNVRKNGVTIFSTKPQIAAGSTTSVGGAVPGVLSTTAIADDDVLVVDIDQIGSTVAGTGLKITFIGTRI